MEAPISYEEALARYPIHVQEVVEKLRSGTSIHKNAAPSELDWKLSWCVRGEALPAHEAIAKALAERQSPRPELTDDEIVADFRSRTSACLAASKGRWSGISGSKVEDFPPEMEIPLREGIRKNRVEKERIHGMAPEERQREVNGLLKSLSRSKGFIKL